MTRNRTIALILAVILPIAFIVLGIGSIAVMGALKPKPEERNEAPKALAVFVAEAVREECQQAQPTNVFRCLQHFFLTPGTAI